MAEPKTGYALHVEFEYIEQDGKVKVSDNDFNAYGFETSQDRDTWAKGLRDVVGHYNWLSSIAKTGALGSDPVQVIRGIVKLMCQDPSQPKSK